MIKSKLWFKYVSSGCGQSLKERKGNLVRESNPSIIPDSHIIKLFLSLCMSISLEETFGDISVIYLTQIYLYAT